jgi:MFS family permease
VHEATGAPGGDGAGRWHGFLATDAGRGFRALRHPGFRRLYVAFLILQTGFWLSHISLQAVVADLSDSDPFQVGLLFFALFAPALFLAPFAGVAADRWDRQRILVVCWSAMGALVATLAVLVATGLATIWVVLGFAAGLGSGQAFLGPASLAVVADAVPALDLASAISLQSFANNLTRVVGPLLAAGVLAVSGAQTSFGAYAVVLMVVVALVRRIDLVPHVPEPVTEGIVQRVRGGFAHARERFPALPALATVCVVSLFGVSHVALLPTFSEDALGDDGLFTALVAATGVGAMAGAVMTGYRWSEPSLRTAGQHMACYGLALAAFASCRVLVLALAAQMVVGFFYFSTMTMLQTLIQRSIDDAKRGRVMSLFNVAWSGLVPIGSLSMGAVAGAVGASATIITGGALCATFGAYRATWGSRRPEPAVAVGP